MPGARADGISSAGVTARSAVEVEVARRALLEPQTVVVRCVLEKLGRLLQRVLLLVRLGRWGRAAAVLSGEGLFNAPLAGLTGGVGAGALIDYRLCRSRHGLGGLRGRSWVLRSFALNLNTIRGSGLRLGLGSSRRYRRERRARWRWRGTVEDQVRRFGYDRRLHRRRWRRWLRQRWLRQRWRRQRWLCQRWAGCE